ncbi:alcohol dehydrogenase [Xylariomycetidae sp. FL2044]|nr:alcohol dehydrogenase [Xylariomycetidae sp. FL2044]
MSDLPNTTTTTTTTTTTMRALVAPRFTKPSGYEVQDVPVPSISQPTDILIRVHAVDMQTGDTQAAAGAIRMFGKPEFPLKLGMGASGVVIAVGSEVTRFQPGDAVVGFSVCHPLNLIKAMRLCAEYGVLPEALAILKPPSLSFEEATALLGSTLTAYQTIEAGLSLMRDENENTNKNDNDNDNEAITTTTTPTLKGKTVFVPGALSGTGHAGLQLLRNHYGAARVVSTVSTAKMPLVTHLLPPGAVDQVIDYQTTRVRDALAPGSVDFIYNTQFDVWNVSSGVPALKNNKNHHHGSSSHGGGGGGVVASIASPPTSAQARRFLSPDLPFWVYWALDLANLWYAWRLRGTGIRHVFVSGDCGVRADLERAGEFLDKGLVRPVMRVVDLEDLEAVRRECGHLYSGKGGLGKLVIKVI